jgi:predicted O-methyltransferase YrrM
MTKTIDMGTSIFDLRGLLWPDWLRDHWLSLGGSLLGVTEPTVSQVLYSLAIANKPTDYLPHSPYTIVETGIRSGATACWLAIAAKEINAKYYGIEVQQNSALVVEELFKKHDLTSNAKVIVGSAPEKVVEIFQQAGEGCSIDLMFIDDDHSAAQVKKEVEVLWPLIRPGGFMTFHDVIGGFPVWEIIKPLGAMKLVAQPFNQMGQPPFGGLGIIRKPVE